ncbi:MAG TPA: O-methyltransferase [Solirubrobacteraceae bacterium]|nr:O-methyltransferase [Solirubrobacteraceae bacterium]
MAELIASDAEGFAEAHTTALTGETAGIAAWTAANTPTPEMMSGLVEARLLEMLVVATGARHVLEVGTFTGVGTLTMAAALPAGGRVTTLERDEAMGAVARRHFGESPYAERIELIVGDAVQTIAGLKGPFDVVYIDAAKVQYPDYYEGVLPKLAPRGVIVADNLFRAGATLDPAHTDAHTEGVRRFARRVQDDPRVHNALLTVGDGLLMAWPAPDPG